MTAERLVKVQTGLGLGGGGLTTGPVGPPPPVVPVVPVVPVGPVAPEAPGRPAGGIAPPLPPPATTERELPSAFDLLMRPEFESDSRKPPSACGIAAVVPKLVPGLPEHVES